MYVIVFVVVLLFNSTVKKDLKDHPILLRNYVLFGQKVELDSEISSLKDRLNLS